MVSTDERFTITEAAEHLGVHRDTVDRWATQGVGGHRLPVVRIGGRRFVRKDDLEQFLAVLNGHDQKAEESE